MRRTAGLLVRSRHRHAAHLETPASACVPAGKNWDMAPANTSFHGLSEKQTRADQWKVHCPPLLQCHSTSTSRYTVTALINKNLKSNLGLFHFLTSLNKPLKYAKQNYFSVESMISRWLLLKARVQREDEPAFKLLTEDWRNLASILTSICSRNAGKLLLCFTPRFPIYRIAIPYHPYCCTGNYLKDSKALW